MYDLGRAFIDVLREWSWLVFLPLAFVVIMAVIEVIQTWPDTESDEDNDTDDRQSS